MFFSITSQKKRVIVQMQTASLLLTVDLEVHNHSQPDNNLRKTLA